RHFKKDITSGVKQLTNTLFNTPEQLYHALEDGLTISRETVVLDLQEDGSLNYSIKIQAGRVATTMEFTIKLDEASTNDLERFEKHIKKYSSKCISLDKKVNQLAQVNEEFDESIKECVKIYPDLKRICEKWQEYETLFSQISEEKKYVNESREQ